MIPVLLPGVAEEPELPLFLQAYTWVDFRGGIAAAGLDRLEWGISGKKPGSPAASAPPAVSAPPVSAPPAAAPKVEPAAPVPPSFWQKHKESLERWALLLGVITLVIGVPGTLLDLPGKWAAFRESLNGKPSPPPAAKQPLRGEFRDAATDQPLAGVRVWLPELQLEAITDANGQFRVELDLPENSYVKLRATLDHYEPVNVDPSVGAFLNVWKMKKLP